VAVQVADGANRFGKNLKFARSFDHCLILQGNLVFLRAIAALNSIINVCPHCASATPDVFSDMVLFARAGGLILSQYPYVSTGFYTSTLLMK
jgi:hypothetical protein